MTLPAQDIVERLTARAAECATASASDDKDRFMNVVAKFTRADGVLMTEAASELSAQNERIDFYAKGQAEAAEMIAAKHRAAVSLTADNEVLRTQVERQTAAGYCDAQWLSDGPPFKCGWQHRAEASEARADALAQEVERLRLPEGTLAKHGSTITIEFDNAEYALRAFDAIEYAMSREPVALANEEAGQ